MPASYFDVKPMTGRPKFIVRHSTLQPLQNTHTLVSKMDYSLGFRDIRY
jgi:hypothetical protein